MVSDPSLRSTIDAGAVFRRYEAIRSRLPKVPRSGRARSVKDLGAVMDEYDVFIFDSFGVLNVGRQAISEAVVRVGNLRRAGKKLFVLTNAASTPLRALRAKYRELGFDFAEHEIVSSRAVTVKGLAAFPSSMTWGVIAPPSAEIEELPVRTLAFLPEEPDRCDGLIFLSSAGWTDGKQEALRDWIERNPVPLLVANPDLAAPRETDFSKEPGYFAHELADALGITPQFYGKPYGNAFRLVFEHLNRGSAGARALMIGDTLHTDILGGQAAGCDAALVTAHGVLRDLDVERCIASSGIRPDLIMATI